MNDDPFETLLTHYGRRGAFLRSFHIAERPGFIYVNNPRVVSSTTKASLNQAVAGFAGIPLTYANLAQVHDRAHNPLQMPQQVGRRRFADMLRDPQVMRFAFVRDPVSRFCSTYYGRIRLRHGRAFGQRVRLFEHLGLDIGDDLSLADFAEACARDERVLMMDHHWWPQRHQIAFDVVDFGFIGRHAHWHEDFNALTRHLFGHAAKVFDTRQVYGWKTQAEAELPRLDTGIAALIRDIYAPDQDMLDTIEARELYALPDRRS